MHRREFLRKALGLAVVAGTVGAVASPAEALSALAGPPQPDPNEHESQKEETANRGDVAEDDNQAVEFSGKRGGRGGGRGRGRGRGWGFGRRGWGRRRRVRRGWYRRRRWGWYRRRRRWWGRRRRWWRRRRRVYYF